MFVDIAYTWSFRIALLYFTTWREIYRGNFVMNSFKTNVGTGTIDTV